MENKILISIPTYWTSSQIHRDHHEVYFDHPTCLEEEEVLSRLLRSLAIFSNCDFAVSLIIATTNNSDVELVRRARSAVEMICEPFRSSFPIYICDYLTLQKIKNCCSLQPELQGDLDMKNYGQIRNIQLLMAEMLQAEVMVGLDDDEVITDPRFLDKCMALIHGPHMFGQVKAGGGFYSDKAGHTHHSKMPTPPADNIFYCKSFIKNKGFTEVFETAGDIVKAKFIFGGCLILHRDFYRKVCYDPTINRGENMDYLINAKMRGLDMYLDKRIRILHLPPEKPCENQPDFLNTGAHSQANFWKLVQDIERFTYEKEKIAAFNRKNPESAIAISDLMPYPGLFFSKNLGPDSRFALQHLFPEQAIDKAEADRFLVRILQQTGSKIAKFERFFESWEGTIEAFRGKADSLTGHSV